MRSICISLLFVTLTMHVFAQSGITWDAPLDIADATFDNKFPRMALDGEGNPLVIWGDPGQSSVYFSRWDGVAFTTPEKLNPDWLTVATAGWMGPDIAAYGDTVYVVVKRTPEDIASNRIFLISSFDGGISFGSPVELGFIGDSISRFPTVTTDDDGNPIIAFMKFNPAFLDSRWVVTRSADLGISFSDDVKASGWDGSAEVCDCCPGAVVASGDNCAVLYRNNDENIRDNWAGISSDHANAFTTGFAMETSNWMLMACPSSGPDGVIIGDTLFSVFMNGASGMNRTYFSKSSISSGALGGFQLLTGMIAGMNLQNYPRIASDGDAMGIVWKQTISGTSELPILFTNNYTTGIPVDYEIVYSDNISNPDIAVRNGNVFVTWQDDNSGTVKCRKGTYTPLTTDVPSIDSENYLQIFPNPALDVLFIRAGGLMVEEIEIFNIAGNRVFTGTVHSVAQISVAGWQPGVYLIKIKSSEGNYQQTFVKQ